MPRPKKEDWHKWVPVFLEELSNTGHVGRAAEAANITRQSVYYHKRRNPAFVKMYERALVAGKARNPPKTPHALLIRLLHAIRDIEQQLFLPTEDQVAEYLGEDARRLYGNLLFAYRSCDGVK